MALCFYIDDKLGGNRKLFVSFEWKGPID